MKLISILTSQVLLNTVACCTNQIVTHGDEAGTEVVWVHHAVSLLQRKNRTEQFRYRMTRCPVQLLAWPNNPNLRPAPGHTQLRSVNASPCRSGWRRPWTRWAVPGWCPWRRGSGSGSPPRWWFWRWWWAAAPSPRGRATEVEENTL